MFETYSMLNYIGGCMLYVLGIVRTYFHMFE